MTHDVEKKYIDTAVELLKENGWSWKEVETKKENLESLFKELLGGEEEIIIAGKKLTSENNKIKYANIAIEFINQINYVLQELRMEILYKQFAQNIVEQEVFKKRFDAVSSMITGSISPVNILESDIDYDLCAIITMIMFNNFGLDNQTEIEEKAKLVAKLVEEIDPKYINRKIGITGKTLLQIACESSRRID